MDDADLVFRALADPSRRLLLDRLFAKNGQTLSDLCEGIDMTRQAVTKHLRVLEDVGLVRSDRVGRDRLWQVEAQRLAELRKSLEEISARWDVRLERLRSYVEDDGDQ